MVVLDTVMRPQHYLPFAVIHFHTNDYYRLTTSGKGQPGFLIVFPAQCCHFKCPSYDRKNNKIRGALNDVATCLA